MFDSVNPSDKAILSEIDSYTKQIEEKKKNHWLNESRQWKLQLILESYAPTERAQEDCRHIYGKMVDDGLSTTDIEKQIVSAISDGLNYGNWPWTLKTSPNNPCANGCSNPNAHAEGGHDV